MVMTELFTEEIEKMFHPHVIINAIEHGIEELLNQARAEAPQTRLDAIVSALDDMQASLEAAKDAWALEDTDAEIAAYHASQTEAQDASPVQAPIEDHPDSRISRARANAARLDRYSVDETFSLISLCTDDAIPEYDDVHEFRVYREHSICGVGLCQGAEIVDYVGDRKRTQYTVIQKASTFTRRYVAVIARHYNPYQFVQELTSANVDSAYAEGEGLTSDDWPICALYRDGVLIATYHHGRWGTVKHRRRRP